MRIVLEILYLSKWLPYQHLWPFLRNHLDNWKALEVLKRHMKALGILSAIILILEAGKDELVPNLRYEQLEKRC